MVHMVYTWITSNVNIWLRCGESMVSSMVDVYHGGFHPPLNSPPPLDSWQDLAKHLGAQPLGNSQQISLKAKGGFALAIAWKAAIQSQLALAKCLLSASAKP